ncbi:MAG: ribulose-phosphate 3-epimerase [Anaerolineae bacterium]|nr:ribulose-phosphate 3-epimerase [Anaerolineae bacterium]
MSESREVLIAPSILSADFARLGEEVREAEAGGADIIHVDVMDGHFVPNLTVGPLVVQALRPITDLPLHVHLMVEEPERMIDSFCAAGANLITVHVETCPHLQHTLDQILAGGAEPAVTLNPATPLAMLEEVLDQVMAVLVMTVNPGFGGQVLIPSALEKVRRLRRWLNERGSPAQIEVDGGIHEGTLTAAVQAGADILVMGSAIYADPRGPRRAVAHYKGLLESIKPARG